MRCLNLALALCLISALPAYAGLREAMLGIEGNAALSLVRFDRQPNTVAVRTTPTGVEVVVKGVSAKNAKITPPDSHLVSAIDVSPIDGGVRLLYYFKTPPVKGSAVVYDHAIMIRVNFDHSLHAQNARLEYTAPAASKPIEKASLAHQGESDAHDNNDDHASTPSPTQSEAASRGEGPPSSQASPSAGASASPATSTATPGHQAPAARRTYNTKKKPLLDSDMTAPVNPKLRGTGMIRDASAKHMAQSLDAASCAAAEKAIEDDPWALDKLSVYGACIAKEGHKDEAKEVFERLLTFDPEMISAYMGLGSIAQDSGDITAAKRYYQQALDVGGSDAQAANVRALLGTLEEKH